MIADAFHKSEISEEQYSLTRILGIWIAAAAPMGFLTGIAAPVLAPDFELDPAGVMFTRMVLITLGLLWQVVLSFSIVAREEGELGWRTVRRRLWLDAPRDPHPGGLRRSVWLWTILCTTLFFFMARVIARAVDAVWETLFPFFTATSGADLDAVLKIPELAIPLADTRAFLEVFLILTVLTIIGEELLFRGVLLPKMRGVFGKWDWAANGMLFGAYQWHQPWTMASEALLLGPLCYALPVKYFRSAWISILLRTARLLWSIPAMFALGS